MWVILRCTKGCATGSWDPDKPAKDAWAEPGGRLMVTSLSALTLEVYYRYLPLYKLDNTASTRSLVVGEARNRTGEVDPFVKTTE